MLISDWNQGKDSTIEPALIKQTEIIAQGNNEKNYLSLILFNYEQIRNNFYSLVTKNNWAISRAIEDLTAMGTTLPENPTATQIKIYYNQLMTYIYKRSAENGGQNRYYGDFAHNCIAMVENFNTLTLSYFNDSSSINIAKIFKKVYPSIEDQNNEKNNLLENFNSFLNILKIKNGIAEESQYNDIYEYPQYLIAIDFIDNNF